MQDNTLENGLLEKGLFDIDISNELSFSEDGLHQLDIEKYGKEKWSAKEWPVVYLIYNDREVYVGETVDAKTRMSQHLENEMRRSLENFVLISDGTFNKSVTQDLEAWLIQHVIADTRFEKIQNRNFGFQIHSYYNDEKYEALFGTVWKKMRKRNLAKQSKDDVENSNIFKYSPFKTLTEDQYQIMSEIVRSFADPDKSQKNQTFIIHGGAGTGKTVLGIYLLKLLTAKPDETITLDDADTAASFDRMRHERKDFKVGLVIPMSNLRTIVKETLRHIDGLPEKIVLSPNEVAKSNEKFDLLIVDEAHRLRRRKNLTMYKSFDECNRRLGLGPDGTELDWILKQSKNQIFLYDCTQSIKPTDIPKERIEKLKQNHGCTELYLRTQIRCKRGGETYIEYIRNIFSNNNLPRKPQNFIKSGYDLRLFNNVAEMVSEIKKKNAKYGLCRTVAGYAWDWKTKGKIKPFTKDDADLTDKLIESGLYDIGIDGAKFIWNTEYNGWLAAPNSVNEIGCIHTIQGFDLNYAGVIIGDELRYSEEKGLYIDRKNYKDRNGLSAASDEELLEYILNIYKVLCTRGMLGTYIYACDEGLRDHLRKYMLSNNTTKAN